MDSGESGGRKKYRNSVFSSSDEEDEPKALNSRKNGLEEPIPQQSGSRKGLFDEGNDVIDDNVEIMIKERQQQKKAHYENLQTKLQEAIQSVDSHKNQVESMTLQLAESLAKIEKRNRQLHNAKTVVRSLQDEMKSLEFLLEAEKEGRAIDREEWEAERKELLNEIEELKKVKDVPVKAAPSSPTTLLGKVWSRKPKSASFTSQRPPMFNVPTITSDEEESSDSILGSDPDFDVPGSDPEEPSQTRIEEDLDQKAIPIGVSRMNYYMEERMKKEAEKRQKELKELQEKSKLKEDFENEWAALAQETKELKKQKKLKKPTKTNTRITRQRPGSFKQVPSVVQTPTTPVSTVPSSVPVPDLKEKSNVVETTPKPPLPPEPSEADMELYRRQQARLHELHESERLKREKVEEADALRSQLHNSLTEWAENKSLLGLLSTLDQVKQLDGIIDPSSLSVTNDGDSIKKGYRNLIRIIHPDKLRNASTLQQLAAKEVFTIVNQAFESFKQSN